MRHSVRPGRTLFIAIASVLIRRTRWTEGETQRPRSHQEKDPTAESAWALRELKHGSTTREVVAEAVLSGRRGCAWTPSNQRGTASYATHPRRCIGVAPCTVPPTSTNSTGTEAAKETRRWCIAPPKAPPEAETGAKRMILLAFARNKMRNKKLSLASLTVLFLTSWLWSWKGSSLKNWTGSNTSLSYPFKNSFGHTPCSSKFWKFTFLLTGKSLESPLPSLENTKKGNNSEISRWAYTKTLSRTENRYIRENIYTWEK